MSTVNEERDLRQIVDLIAVNVMDEVLPRLDRMEAALAEHTDVLAGHTSTLQSHLTYLQSLHDLVTVWSESIKSIEAKQSIMDQHMIQGFKDYSAMMKSIMSIFRQIDPRVESAYQELLRDGTIEE